MENVSGSSEINKRSNGNGSQESKGNICNENDHLPTNRMLHLFVQYAWNPEHGPCYDGPKYKKLEKWLELLFTSEGAVEYSHLHVSYSIKKWPDGMDPNINMSVDAQDEIILRHLVDRLGHYRAWLIDGKGDVNYTYTSSTVLHRFLLNIANTTDRKSSEVEKSKLLKLVEGLVRMKVSLYAMDSRGRTPLDLAGQCEHSEILRTMICSLDDVNARDGNGNTALHVVLVYCFYWKENCDNEGDYVDFVRTLVSKGANVNARNGKGVSPIHLAAKNFQVDMLKLFADKGANFDERTNDGETPLHFAGKWSLELRGLPKMTEVFDFLIAQGCDLEAADNEGQTLLHYAVEFQHVEIVEKFIALGLNIDCRTAKTQLTPLYIAARSDRLDVMKSLIAAGADVNAEAADGSTPIFMSTMLGSYESMQFLVDNGAELHRREQLMGFTLLHVAANGVDSRSKRAQADETQAERKRKLRKLEVLIDAGLDVNDTGNCGVTPLQLAVLALDVDAVKLLLDRGAEVDLQSTQWSALQLASLMKDLEAVRILVAHGADVNRRGGRGLWAPLHLVLMTFFDFFLGVYPRVFENNDARLSCPVQKLWSYTREMSCKQHQWVDFLTILIDNGACVNVHNAYGQTPLHLVWDYDSDLMKKLLDAGAEVNVQNSEGILPIHYVCRNHHTEKFQLLVDRGADINDDDTSKLLVNRDGARIIAVEHAIKRRLVDLPIAEVYESWIREPRFADFYEQCSQEATTLRNHRDDSGFSLYEFLKTDARLQYQFIDKISDSYKNLEELFPLYANLIRGTCRESAIRRQLLESAGTSLAENTGVRLPDICVELILSHLSNRHLKLMTTDIEKIANDGDKRIAFVYKIKCGW